MTERSTRHPTGTGSARPAPTTTDPARPRLARRALLTSGAAALGLAALAPAAGAAVDARPVATAAGLPAARRGADAAQRALTRLYGAPWPQLLHNAHPSSPQSDEQLNYWWYAHVVDAKIDGFDRTGRRTFLTEAERVVTGVRQRNGDTLVNDYFDDMNWMALALHRLWRSTGRRSYRDDAVGLWEEIVAEGWNETYGPSVAWRREQLDYKNTPSNAPFAILSYRLHRDVGGGEYLAYADAATTWMRDVLVDPGTGFVADGINRQGDGAVDWQWRFTYCQGVWTGALVEAFRTHGDDALLVEATRTAVHAVRELTSGPVFSPEGQGDGGLFKGIWYRYAADLLRELGAGPERRELATFVRASSRMLQDTSTRGDLLLAGPDWTRAAPSPTDLSTHLSGLMALEARVAIDG